MKIKGKWITIRVNGATIALATSHTFEYSLNTIDARVKSDNGAYDIADDIAWNITSESIVGINEGIEQQTYATLMTLFLSKERIEVETMLPANATDSIPSTDWAPGPMTQKGFAAFRGEALIKSIALNAPNDSKASISVQLSGQGELIPVTSSVTASVVDNTLYIDGNAEVIDGNLFIDDADVYVNENILNF